MVSAAGQLIGCLCLRGALSASNARPGTSPGVVVGMRQAHTAHLNKEEPAHPCLPCWPAGLPGRFGLVRGHGVQPARASTKASFQSQCSGWRTSKPEPPLSRHARV